MDYDSRQLYFLKFTYVNLKPLICVLWWFFLVMHVSVVYTYQYIILLQLMVSSSVRPAVVSPFLGLCVAQCAAMPRTLGHVRTKICLYI